MPTTCLNCGASVQPGTTFCDICGARQKIEGARLGYPAGQPSPSGAGFLSAGTLLAGRYRLDARAGAGAMGEVWRARDERLNGRLCAVKGILIDGTNLHERAERQAVMEREAGVLSRLHHAGICTILDSVRVAGALFLVLEWIEGRTLDDELALRGAPGMPLAEVLGWAARLADALDYLHGQTPSIIIRDLKPTNIMLGVDGRITLIDFGLARPAITGGGTIIGTPGYAPPEQYNGIADPRSDVYSLAATLHHLLTGRNPAHSKPFDFPAVRTLIPALPVQIEAALTRALQMPAALRFSTVREFVSALTAAPVTTSPSPTVSTAATRHINIRADGSGDYLTLEVAVRQAPASATITLAAGEYKLRQSLQVARALTLLGAGMDQTRLVCAETGPVVLFEGSGPFTAKGLTFAHVGLKVSDVVMVMKGRVDFQDCRFTGGVHDAANGERGNGLWLRDDACGTIRDCTASGNEWNGLRVSDQAEPTLEANTCEQNKGSGIAYLGTARGTARNNVCRGNEEHGISVVQQAQPNLETNICEKNRGSGIAYFDSATGAARQNTCRANKCFGILVDQQASPIREANKLEGNTKGTESVIHTARPSARPPIAPAMQTRGISAPTKRTAPTPKRPV